METITHAELLKRNLLHLVEDHREKCDKTCNVSLCLVLEVAQNAGMEFTDDETKVFL